MKRERKMLDCRDFPNEIGCTLLISGSSKEVFKAAFRHAIEEHGHKDTPELRKQLKAMMVNEINHSYKKKIKKRNQKMKSILNLTALLLFLTSASLAQDWAKTDPKMNNILADTTLLRATIAIIEPGQKSGIHTHPAHFFYALTDGKIKVYYTDGETAIFDLKTGEYGFANPEKPHQTENLSDKTIKFLLVELKEHPYVNTSDI